ncbi:MAG: GNAT family N-acetyltransferase [Chloroflexi bacterium]|nr:GNAT family N-acetyltransferase [Chloroflexota bacterium]
MFELVPSDFHKAQSLFDPLMATQMFCAGVLEGLYAGRVFVDDPEQPRSGFVAKDGGWWFLAGDPGDEAFNRALNTALFDRTILGEKGWGGMLVCHPADWDAQIPAIYAPRIPNVTERLHYTCRRLEFDWRGQIPDGIEVRFVDETLAADGIEIHGAAADVLALRRDALEPDRKAVGFVAVHDGRIVASSVIDCIVGGGGDIGLFTDGEYRRRGLAALTSAAVIEYALSHGVDVVHWDCQAFNMGSIRTAEKLGLELSGAHLMYTFILNPVIHDVNRAWAQLDAGHYDRTAGICRQAIEAAGDSAHVHFYYVLARCLMASGRPDEALKNLEVAARLGWDSAEEAETDFTTLAGDPSWAGILDQMRVNAGAGAG